MAYLLTRRAGLDPRYTGQPRIPRREFGRILFGLTGNTLPPQTFSVQNELSGTASPHAPMAWSSGTAMTAGINEYGRCITFPGTGGTPRTGWQLATGASAWLPAGTSKLSAVFLGRAIGNMAYGLTWLYSADYNGNSANLFGISPTDLYMFQGRPAQSGNRLSYQFTIGNANGKGNLCSAAAVWSGGSSAFGYMNGVASGVLNNATTSLVAGPTGPDGGGLGAAVTYTVGHEVNLAIVGDAALPRSLAEDISNNAWLAFEPVRKAFYFAGEADTTAPAWGGGAAITASNVTHSAFDLAWPAATDAVGVTQYRYRIDGDAWNNTGTTRSASITGLAAGTGYDVEVCAGDAADNWSTALELTVTTQSLKVNPSIYDPAAGTARASQTGLGVLVLGEKPGATDTPTVLAHSGVEATDGSGVMDINLNTAGVDPGDIVWVVLVKSDGVPANAGYSLCWPVTVVAV